MQIADTRIPIAQGHAPIVVISNLTYVLAALAVVTWTGLLGWAVAFALVVQAIGSMLFHATRSSAQWAQLLDAIGIQWVLAALLAASITAYFDAVLWFWTGIAVVTLWPLWWLFAHRVERIPASILQGLWILFVIVHLEGWLVGAGFVAAMAAAGWLQWTGRTHGWRHALWHLITASVQCAAALILLGG